MDSSKKFKMHGFVTLLAVSLIVLFGLLLAALVHFNVSMVNSGNNRQATHKALDLANSGLEDAQMQLHDPNLATRDTCTGLNLTQNLGNDKYVVSSVGNAPNLTSTTLASSITAASTSITLASSASFGSQGRITLDRENIDYTINNTSSNTLSGLTRATNGTRAASHASGAVATQYQCMINSIGSSPANSPYGQVQLNQAAQLEVGWAVGDNNLTLYWNKPTEGQWNLSTSGGTTTWHTISVMGYAGTGYEAGDCETSLWIVSSLESWNVGNCASPYDLWTQTPSLGSNCQVQTSSSCGGKSISTSSGNSKYYGIQAIDTDGNGTANFGFAVGGSSTTNGNILVYNGTVWSDSTINSSVGQLNAVSIIYKGSSTPTQAWAVGYASNGTSGVILKWSSGSWNIAVSPSQPMNAITMLGSGSATYGWAVGNNGAAYVYNGSGWTNSNIGSTSLYAVQLLTTKDGWAGGANGVIYHWNGSSWTSATTGYTTTSTIRAMAFIGPNNYQTQSGWAVISQ